MSVDGEEEVVGVGDGLSWKESRQIDVSGENADRGQCRCDFCGGK